MPRKAVKHMV